MRLCAVLAVVLCAAATSFGAISVQGAANPKTLVYSSPSDLGTGADIDPAGLRDVQVSYGVSKATFQANPNVQVIGFNAGDATNPNVAPAGFAHQLRSVVANYSATDTVTFTFPANVGQNYTPTAAEGYNFGTPSSKGRGAFSGADYNASLGAIGGQTVDPITGQTVTQYFDATITTTGNQGVGALGFCMAFRDDQNVPAGYAAYTLSNGSVATVDLPTLGLLDPAPYEYIFLGYQAPAGLTITRVQVGMSTNLGSPGGNTPTVDDLSFVMTAVPEPATLSLLALSGLMMLRRRHA